MTANEFQECLFLLNWGTRVFARVLDVNERTVRNWCLGSSRVPDTVASWLDRVAAFHALNPPPMKESQCRDIDLNAYP